MAGGYELTYRRLGMLEFPRERMQAALEFVKTARLGAHEFRLVMPVDAPPQVLPIFELESDEPTAGRKRFDFQYQGEPHLYNMVCNAFFDIDHLKAFVKEALGPLDFQGHQTEHSIPDVKLAYPCEAEVCMSGRHQGQGRSRVEEFGGWLREQFSQKFGPLMEDRSKELRQAAQRRCDSDAFQREAAETLEDLAVNELAEKLSHFAKIPNVIERAAKLFVVADVMGS